MSSDFPESTPAGSAPRPPSYQPAGSYSAFPGGYPLPGQSADYGGGVKVTGVVLTVVAPWLALIAALVLRASEASLVRRASLRSWAILSGAWLALSVLVPLVGLGVFGSDPAGVGTAMITSRTVPAPPPPSASRELHLLQPAKTLPTLWVRYQDY